MTLKKYLDSDQSRGIVLGRRLCAKHGSGTGLLTMFSIAPLLLIAISIAGLIFGVEAARGEIVDSCRAGGAAGAEAVQGLLVS